MSIYHTYVHPYTQVPIYTHCVGVFAFRLFNYILFILLVEMPSNHTTTYVYVYVSV